MGFDLYGSNPKTEKGEYFRNNVWWWRRLAEFVCEYTGVVDDKDKERWQFNDNHHVTAQEAKEIAKQLRYLIKTGQVAKYEEQVRKEMEEAEVRNKKVQKLLDKLKAKAIEMTNNKDISPREYPSPLDEKWEKLWHMQDGRDSYPFNKNNVEEFIKFCEDSNGFSIS
jgi:hypothetical protein